MSLLGIGVVLILVGAVLALATTVDSFGWLLAVGGLVCIIVWAVMAASAHRRT